MTIDERLQALTESLKSLGSLHRDLERGTNEKIQALANIAEQNEVRAGEMLASMAETRQNMGDMREVMERLARIALTHEERFERLEG
jgi:hypothetical protein